MATTTVKIDVNDEDIASGERGQCGKCPVALAVCRAIPQATRVEVYDDGIKFDLPGVNGTICCGVPRSVTAFVNGFDDGDIVTSFSFGLTYEIPA